MRRKATMNDVAKNAGVSISTVSRVINGSNTKVASPKVQERIWNAVRELNYIPNIYAQNLKTPPPTLKKGATLGIVLARTDDKNENPFFVGISNSFEKTALSLGYNISFVITFKELKKEGIHTFLNKNKVDGIAIIGKYNRQLEEAIRSKNIKYIYTGLNEILNSDLDQVVCDGYHASVSAINYLYKLNHRKIGYLGEVKDEVRFNGYRDTVRFLGLPFNSQHVFTSKFTTENAYQVMLKAIDAGIISCDESSPSAIFCGNDLVAIGAIRALLEKKIRIPDDISIISIDDIDLIQMVTPLLTTVHVPVEELGHVAAELLIKRVEEGRRISQKIELPYFIVERESCRKIDFQYI